MPCDLCSPRKLLQQREVDAYDGAWSLCRDCIGWLPISAENPEFKLARTLELVEQGESDSKPCFRLNVLGSPPRNHSEPSRLQA
jgi:hypothetical protein